MRTVEVPFFAGYAKEHAGDVYRMINLQTIKVIETRNVTFVGKYSGKFMIWRLF